MADVLSQSEIDALLSALSTGELEPETVPKDDEKHKIKLYDFKSPQKFSKDHIRTLELIHDNFARITSNYLTGQIRKNVKVKIETVEQITYEEFIHSVQNPTIITIFKMPPLTGSIIFETNPQLSFQIIDILLGGSGDRKIGNKEFSDIDKNIIRQITTGMISNLKLAWEDILNVSPEVEGIETNPAINQTLAPNEPVALITFSVEFGEHSTFMNMCIPYLSIEKVLDKLVVQYWFQNDDEALIAESRVKMEEGIQKVDIEVFAELGNTNIIVDDFLKLTKGDIIKLDNKSSSPIKVYVGDEKCYYAKPGVTGKNMGVAILDIIDKEVKEYE
ncbi:flagellar motor switch protein FliM [Clostridium botulinum]|uniref:Flagellar motor switch protein FliM n=1 Tax=Clostridium botulinum TaxID=1491 RepID=A0A0L9Y8N1_CLOBO|nr:flagellar motor switch protein FliM [Clostridium botulinum]KAI3350312.1 flagellar motor switch protein FliM [Clostridium botulinum]KOM88155.1 flagellar motor switch protein FliM [Clostridium botulinum]KOR55434.1 flagellar motor switch protein FliM [Clostridium botulinum]MCS6111723.1 flagellar motor switch protein FliM [Clostridium botulinum]NFE12915.1 flagellar motor switch protein FliM [Clostridium botulinum]